MNIKLSVFLVALFTGLFGFSQIHNPVKWQTEVHELKNGVYELNIEATIQKGWHLYSQHIQEGGPVPTTFFYPKKGVQFLGTTTESNGEEINDPIFDMKIKYFSNTARFYQQFKLIDENLDFFEFSVEYMVCDDANCLPPKEVTLKVDLTKIQKESTFVNQVTNQTSNFFMLFVLSFIAGLSAIFTPCVFPMIPMTVSFFTKQGKGNGIFKALFYGFSIIFIYVMLATLVVAVFGPAALNALATSVWFNLLFFALLVVFAASFLGAFELVLPSSWATKLDNKADKGGYVGIFFMALALAVVSFSCTGPIVGTALVESATQGGIAPIVSMFGFSLAIALPFTLFAIFPNWLQSLPKSGSWLNTVKVVLGFIELALAFKFLSNVDLVLQSHWLERELFVAIWIAIGLVMFLYLLGKIRLPHDYQVSEHLGVGRLFFALLVLVFVIYLIPGLFGGKVSFVNALVPPQSYSENQGNQLLSNNNTNPVKVIKVKGAHQFVPYGFTYFDDYETGLAYAKKVNKPVMLDFTGRACVNCRKMEQNVWSDPRILDILTNKVVLISLYVDDRQSLGHNEISPVTGKPYKYIGQKWSEFQLERYQTNAQPFYVLLNSDGQDISKPIGYTPDVATYLSWFHQSLKK